MQCLIWLTTRKCTSDNLCRRLLKKGGLLVADNVGFKDADAFNRTVFASQEWKSVNLLAFLPLHSPEKDGLCLALRR